MKSRFVYCDQSDKENVLSERGFMAAEWSAGVALLLLPAFVLVFTVIQIPARKSLSQAAASAAARAYVQVLDQSQAERAARAAALAVVQDEYPSAEASDINFSVVSSSDYCPGNEVTIRIGIYAPVVINPFNGDDSASSGILINSNSTERIFDYAEIADSETGLGPTPDGGYDSESVACES